MTLTRLDCIRTNAMQTHLHHRLQTKLTPLEGQQEASMATCISCGLLFFAGLHCIPNGVNIR